MARYRQAGSSYRTRDRDGLTRAFRAVLQALRKAANDRGLACLTNGELAAKADVSRRSVQAATAYLVENGFIVKIERRRTKEYSDPNIYRVSGAKKFSVEGRKNRTQKPRRGESKKHTSSLPPSAADASCNQTLTGEPRRGHSRRPVKAYRAPRTPALPSGDREKITAALQRLGIDLGNHLALTDGQLLDFIDRLRIERIPAFAAGTFAFRATVHGVQAWYGVIETVAMLDGHIPQKDGGIRNAAAYLGGILWKDETNPRKTVFDWLDIEDRKAAEAEAEQKRAEYAAAKSERIAAQRERNQILDRAWEILACELPASDFVSWVQSAQVLKIEDERIVLQFPTATAVDIVRSKYQRQICAAFAKVRNEATSVVLVGPRGVRNG